MSTAWTITFDCAEPAILAAFWRRALGYVEGAPPAGSATWEEYLASVGVPPEEWGDGAYIEDPEGLRPAISFLKVPEVKTAKNRVHLDLAPPSPDQRDEEVRRITALGATVVDDRRKPDGTGWVVLADPEGNEFCVERGVAGD